MNQTEFSKYMKFLLVSVSVLVATSVHALQQTPDFLRHTPQEWFDMANDYLEHRNAPDSALMCLMALTSEAEARGDTGDAPRFYAIAYNAMGAIYASVYGNYPKAVVSLRKGLELSEKNGDRHWTSSLRYNLAAMEYEQGVLSGEEDVYSAAMMRFSDVLDDLDLDASMGLAMPLLVSAAEMSVRQRRVDDGIRMLRRIKDQDSVPEMMLNLRRALESLSQKDSEGAVHILDSTINSLGQGHSVMDHAYGVSLRLMKAHALLDSGREKYALAEYDALVDLCEKEENLFQVYEIERHLMDHYESIGNLSLAREYEFKALKTKERLILRSNLLGEESTNAIYNEDLLRREVAAEAARTMTYRVVFWISIAFLVVLIALIVILWRKNRQLAKSREVIVRNDKEYFQEMSDIMENGRQDAGMNVDSKGLVTADGRQREIIEKQNENSLFEKVRDIVKSSQEIYDEEFSTARLAGMVGERPGAVSAAIMEATGESTSKFLARARMREACRRFNDKENYGGYTIEAIGQSVGYRSRSHFGSVFKKVIGMSPSEYASKAKS